MTRSKTFAITLTFFVVLVGCGLTPGDGNSDTDAGTPDVDAANGDEVPGPETEQYACRGGTHDGMPYVEFKAKYLNGGVEASAFIVGDALDEGIYGYFHGAWESEPKTDTGWYRHYLIGPDNSTFTLTTARCVDTVGDNAACWSQYGWPLSAAIAGPFRKCGGADGTGSCACSGKVVAGHAPVPLD